VTRGIVSTPGVLFGQARIEQTRVPTSMLGARWAAGDTIAELSLDYELTDAEIVEALRYEMSRLRERNEALERIEQHLIEIRNRVGARCDPGDE
jgi:uncharacterized protein (DUF433 family)